ncbi:hypothetical protein [Fimbriiglobus ruber]|uniref:hypothetical protein n=1 Tax=Fimbriiglobus ruber TaxID=1908690 RepID=UPI00117ADB26|nr:hypothetical protein [Fimbriiglobus ruber]
MRLLHPIPCTATLSLALALALIAGCGGAVPTASVSGNVTSNGKPFDGKIVFAPGGSSTDQKTVEATIQGGRYEVPSIPPGTKAINVFSAASPDDAKQKSNRQNGFWVSNPKTVDLQAGSQSIDFSVTRLAP